jgi:FkbM family methyltransferase
MIYLSNLILLFTLKVANKCGRAFAHKSKILSSKRILDSNFDVKTNFNFIQIGANDGISFDFLYDFVIQRISTGIVLEPVVDYFHELALNYGGFPEIIKINKAVHPSDKHVLIYKISQNSLSKYPEWAKGIASFNSEHLKKHNINFEDVLCLKVEADNLMSIINANVKNEKIDYFQVDTEGYDFEVIKMIDFSTLRPSMLKYEFVNLSLEDQNKATLLLKSQGYYVFKEFNDTVAIDLYKIKLF